MLFRSEAILPESYAIDINGNLIVTYTDSTTENLGKFGNDAINTIDTIAISDDGFYVLNGIKTSIVAVNVFDVNFVTGYDATVKTQIVKDGDKVTRPQRVLLTRSLIKRLLLKLNIHSPLLKEQATPLKVGSITANL